jgi:hypothetical protein
MATFIDYGFSHIKYNGKDYGIMGYENSLITNRGKSICSDVYKFLISCYKNTIRNPVVNDLIKEMFLSISRERIEIHCSYSPVSYAIPDDFDIISLVRRFYFTDSVILPPRNCKQITFQDIRTDKLESFFEVYKALQKEKVYPKVDFNILFEKQLKQLDDLLENMNIMITDDTLALDINFSNYGRRFSDIVRDSKCRKIYEEASILRDRNCRFRIFIKISLEIMEHYNKNNIKYLNERIIKFNLIHGAMLKIFLTMKLNNDYIDELFSKVSSTTNDLEKEWPISTKNIFP